jgi:hypothetical protein
LAKKLKKSTSQAVEIAESSKSQQRVTPVLLPGYVDEFLTVNTLPQYIEKAVLFVTPLFLYI